MTVNERIKNELTARGWSQYHLAKITKIEQSTISKWFQFVPTAPSSQSLKKVAKAFNMTIGQLLGEPDEKDATTQELLAYWARLNAEEKTNVLNIMKTIIEHR